MLWRCNAYYQSLKTIKTFSQCGVNPQLVWARHTSNAPRNPTTTKPELIRNLALVAHIDSGKTTLTESILARSGYLSTPGTVDTGSTTTDFLPAERERGITIQAASIPVSWGPWTVNLIDTPGHADFGMEVESASRVVDGAVVLVDTVEGVESQTQGVWRQLDRYNVQSRVVFMNKLDRTGASFPASIRSLLTHRLHRNPVALTLPIASFDPAAYDNAEPGIEGIVDLVRWELWKWKANDANVDSHEVSFSRHPLPKTIEKLDKSKLIPTSLLTSEIVAARTALLENLAMVSDELMDELINLPRDPSAYLSITPETIIPVLRSATLNSEILPVLCGSAAKHIGTDLVLDYTGLLLASPLDIGTHEITPNEVRLLAWKVAWDKRRGWMTFVRVYSGTLTKQTRLFNVNRNEKEVLSKILLFYASDPEEVDELGFGSVGVITGLKNTRTGDTLVSATHARKATKGREQRSSSSQSVLKDIIPPPAVMSASIIPQAHSDLQPVQDALFALARTDPSARIELADGQLLVHGLGALHLEIIEGRLRDEWGVAFEAGGRNVSYRETFAEGQQLRIRDSKTVDFQGKSFAVEMWLDIRALRAEETGDPQWDENLVLDKEGNPICSPESSAYNSNEPDAQIVQGISSVLIASPHSSLPFSRLRIQVKHNNLPKGAPFGILAIVSSTLLRDAISNVPMGPLMEPYIRLRITVSEDHFGVILKDLTERGGEIFDLDSQASTLSATEDESPYSTDGVYIPPDWVSPSASFRLSGNARGSMRRNIHAVAPLKQMLDFNTRLRALSGGEGTFEMSNEGFRTVTEQRQLEILRELGRA